MDFDDDYDKPSKTTLKRDAEDVRKLGRTLCKLSPGQLARIPLPDDARTAIKDSPKIYQNVAKKRHLQYIGKLLRSSDLAAIKDELDRVQRGLPSLTVIKEKKAPAPDPLAPWLSKLLENDDSGIQEIMEAAPSTDRTQLRQLVRNARKKPAEDSKPMKSLHAYLKSLKL